jgi:hypothetical protein
MTAKRRAHRPKCRRNATELERRVRWLERHLKADALSIATHVARIEVNRAWQEHMENDHADSPTTAHLRLVGHI